MTPFYIYLPLAVSALTACDLLAGKPPRVIANLLVAVAIYGIVWALEEASK